MKKIAHRTDKENDLTIAAIDFFAMRQRRQYLIAVIVFIVSLVSSTHVFSIPKKSSTFFGYTSSKRRKLCF